MIKRSYNLFFSALVLCIGSLSGCHRFPGSGNEVNIVEPKAQRDLPQGKTLTCFLLLWKENPAEPYHTEG